MVIFSIFLQHENYGHLFDFLQLKVCFVYSLESPHQGDSYENIQHTFSR